MPITADSIFLYSYFLCVALMAIVIPLCFYARRKAPGLGRNQRGSVRTDALGIFDLAGLAVFFGIYAVFLKEYLDPPQLDESGNRLEVNITPLILAVGMVVQFVPPLVVAVLLSARGIDLGKFFGINDNKLQQTVKTYQEASAVTVRIMIAISAIIIAPVAEEIVFRGYIYTATKRFSNRFFAAILSSLLFGVVHFNISAFIPLVFLALLLTIAYELSGSIWAPISIHALFNASTILFQEVKFH